MRTQTCRFNFNDNPLCCGLIYDHRPALFIRTDHIRRARDQLRMVAQIVPLFVFQTLYGKAFDQAQKRANNVRSELETRRKKADKLYQELVRRGKKVEKDAQKAIKELDTLTDRKKLEAQLDKAKARFEELRESVGFKSAA